MTTLEASTTVADISASIDHMTASAAPAAPFPYAAATILRHWALMSQYHFKTDVIYGKPKYNVDQEYNTTPQRTIW